MKIDLSLCNLITKAGRVVVHHYQREVNQFGITASQAGVVYILGIIGDSTQVEIASVLHLEKTNINAMVKKLENAELVTIGRDDGDARKSKVMLTKKGTELSKKLKSVDKKVEMEYLGLSGSDKNTQIIKSFLEKIVFQD